MQFHSFPKKKKKIDITFFKKSYEHKRRPSTLGHQELQMEKARVSTACRPICVLNILRPCTSEFLKVSERRLYIYIMYTNSQCASYIYARRCCLSKTCLISLLFSRLFRNSEIKRHFMYYRQQAYQRLIYAKFPLEAIIYLEKFRYIMQLLAASRV